MTNTIVRSTGNAIVAATLLAVGTSALPAQSHECTTLDAASVAKALGVPKARANPPGEHRKLSPNNMDVVGCSYAEATPDPMAKSLVYTVYTPKAPDVASMYESLSHGNVPGNPQAFSPGVGNASSGWVRLSANAETYDGSIVFREPSWIGVVRVSGMANADAAKAALIAVGKVVAKP